MGGQLRDIFGDIGSRKKKVEAKIFNKKRKEKEIRNAKYCFLLIGNKPNICLSFGVTTSFSC